MNRFINNTIQKVSVVNGERKKIFSGKVVDTMETPLNVVDFQQRLERFAKL